MKIKTIIQQSRRDFTAIYECEHCGFTEEGSGYDDNHFHTKIIPSKVCRQCDKTASTDYRPLSTKYPEGVQL